MTLQSLLYHIFGKNQGVFKNIFPFFIFLQFCTVFVRTERLCSWMCSIRSRQNGNFVRIYFTKHGFYGMIKGNYKELNGGMICCGSESSGTAI